MNQRQLECFQMLAEELNFTRAAERLNMAQPPLSRQIKVLEEELGVRLFERTKRQVKLTAEGKHLQQEVEKVFSQWEQAKGQLKKISSGQTGILSIAYVGAAMHSVLPELLKTFCQKYPAVQVHLFEMDTFQQWEALEKGVIDIGFVRSWQGTRAVRLYEVYREPFCLIVPGHVRVALAEPDSLVTLQAMPMIGFPKSCAPQMVDSMRRLLQKLNLQPQQIHESSQMNSIVRIVECGLGYSILPASVSNAYRLNVHYHELGNFGEEAILYAAVKKDNVSRIGQHFLETMGIYR